MARNPVGGMEHISRGFEWIGVAVIIAAFVLATVRSARALAGGGGGTAAYKVGRSSFGWGILLGLELLVAADLIRTIAVQPTLTNVAVLGIIVVVRTFLSFSLDVEIEGRLPWRRPELPECGETT
jgi:uncharacterized membrane protein